MLCFLLPFLQLYVPDEDKSIFGRSVNKQVFEGLTTGLLQTIATILGSLWPHISESGQGEKTWISSPDAKVKSSATESFNTRTQDLIRYFSSNALHSSHTASPPPPTWHSLSHLMTFLLALVHPSSTPLHWVESWSTSDFLSSVPYVKNRLTKCQIYWKWANWCLVRMGVV